MTRTVFSVRVITRDIISDFLSRFRSILGGRVKVYEKARAQKKVRYFSKDNSWHLFMRRIKTEWEMLNNIGKATNAAFDEVLHLTLSKNDSLKVASRS